jgi:hypothetical protein
MKENTQKLQIHDDNLPVHRTYSMCTKQEFVIPIVDLYEFRFHLRVTIIRQLIQLPWGHCRWFGRFFIRQYGFYFGIFSNLSIVWLLDDCQLWLKWLPLGMREWDRLCHSLY